MRYLILAAVVAAFTACNPNPESAGSAQPIEAEPEGTYNPSCHLIRYVETAAAEGIYLIDICAEDPPDNVIDISEPGEKPVVVLFDTIRSFRNQADAEQFAELNGIYDIDFRRES